METIKDKSLKDMSLRELRNKGMKVFAEMQDVYREKRDGKEITKDREEQFDKWDGEMNLIESEIRFKEREEMVNGEEARKGPKVPGTDIDTTEEKYDPKFQPSRREVNLTLEKVRTRNRGYRDLNAREKKVIDLVERESEAFEYRFRHGKGALNEEQSLILSACEKRVEQRAQSTTTTAGGYLIPQGFIPEVIKSMKYISAFFDEFKVGPNGDMQNVFTLYRTDSGNTLPIPTGDDTSNVGELIAENTDASISSADLVFGQKTFLAYKYSTKMIKVSQELLEDSAINVPGYIAEMFGSRIGRIINTHLTTGDNSSKPQGIVTGATAGKIAASSGAISFPEIIDLIHSVDISYRRRPSVRFMMHDSVLKAVKKLTVGAATTNARPLWAPGWDVNAPSTIDGFQYLINNDMSSVLTTGAKMMLFGDMKAYGVRLVNQFRLLDLRERYAEFDQVAWIGFMRADGRILNSSAIKYYAGT